MALSFFNMLLDPFYAAFASFSPDANLFQLAVVVCVILGVISWVSHLIIK